MPILTVNNCEMFYQIDDFTDPWRTDTGTVWPQHGASCEGARGEKSL